VGLRCTVSDSGSRVCGCIQVQGLRFILQDTVWENNPSYMFNDEES